MLKKNSEKNRNREADGSCSKYEHREADGVDGSCSSNNIDNLSSNVVVGCNKCVLLSEHLREFGKDIGKEIRIEFGKELGKEHASKKHMRTKKKLQYERKKSSGLIIGLVLSWIFFLVVFKLM